MKPALDLMSDAERSEWRAERLERLERQVLEAHWRASEAAQYELADDLGRIAHEISLIRDLPEARAGGDAYRANLKHTETII